MPKIALVLLGLALATCGPADNAKLPGDVSAGGGAGGASGSGGGGTNPFAGTKASGGSASAGSTGGSGGHNPFGGSTGGASTGGTAGKAGSVAGSGGRGGSAGTGGGGAGSGGVKGDGSGIPNLPIPAGVAEPCADPKDMSGGNTNQFQTTKAFCFRTCDEIQGWGCSNFDGRTVKVNGKDIKCGEAIPAKLGPFYYFDVSAGGLEYASIYWWGTMYGIPAGGFKKWDGSSPSTGTATGSATATLTSGATATTTANATATATASATSSTSGATSTATASATASGT